MTNIDQTTVERPRTSRPRRSVATLAIAAAGLVAAGGVGMNAAMNAAAPEHPTEIPEGTKVAVTDFDQDGQNEVLLLPPEGTPEENSAIVPLPAELPTPSTTPK